MNHRIRVGLLGANPERGWGSAVHVPAIAALPEFALEAVGTTRRDSAEASAKRFGARLAFDDPQALVEHPDVDLVAISVKAPEHHRLAMLALQAGKHVYCEWPLAANQAQAAAMREAAAAAGVKAAVGLQARAAPALMRARDLVAEGYLGRMIAVRLACALPGGGGRRSHEGLYVIDKRNGASTLAIQGGHAIDALRFAAGEFAGFSAVISNQFDRIEVIETGEVRRKDAPDQILLSGRLQNGAVASVAINGGALAGHGIALELYGTEGTLSITGAGPLNFQMAEIVLRGARRGEGAPAPLEISPAYDPGLIPPGFSGMQPYPGVNVPRATVVNVANLYRRLGQAILHEAPLQPDFSDGLRLHQLLDLMETSSDTGAYQRLGPSE